MYSGLANFFFFLGFVPLSGTQKVAFFFFFFPVFLPVCSSRHVVWSHFRVSIESIAFNVPCGLRMSGRLE